MRTLKKALSLVLVLAMVFALAVPGFAADTTKKAADFKDYSKVTNKEAVDVLTAIGVINGNADGTFAPEGSFTRAEAATMITYLTLGKTVANALPVSATKFSDVPATHWAAKYVQYCADAGIVNGVGDGKFDPDAKLTATQWALMLLGALGYNAKNEGIGGEGWELATTRLAMKAGIASASDLTGTFNRDVAAKMAFKTLTADVVEYATNGTNITIGNTTIATGAGKAEAVAHDNNSGYKASGNDAKTQFCEQHFDKLKLTSGQEDDFGRTSHVWANGTTIGNYANTAAVTFTAKTSIADVTSALAGYTIGGKKINNTVVGGDVAVSIVHNQKNGNKGTSATWGMGTDTTAKAISDWTANGKLVEFFANDNNEITAVVGTEYNTAVVTKISTAKNGNVTYTVGNSDYVDYADSTTDTVVINGTVAKGDVVTYTVVNSKAYVYPTTNFDGVQTATKTNAAGVQTITVSGTTYTVGAAATGTFANSTKGTSATYYVDQFGFVVYTDSKTTASTDYAYVVGSEASVSTSFGAATVTVKAKVVLADGTVAIYPVALTKTDSGDYTLTKLGTTVYDKSEVGSKTDATLTSEAKSAVETALKEKVLGYTITDGTITFEGLTDLPANNTATTENTVYVASLGADTVSKATSYTVNTDKTVLVNNSTVYVAYNTTTDKATVYTGNTSLPASVTSATTANDTAVLKTGNTSKVGTASVVFFTLGSNLTADSTSDLVYVDGTYSTVVVDGKNTCEYTGYKADGTTVALTSSANDLSAGLYVPNKDNTIAAANKRTHDENGLIINGAKLTVDGSMVKSGSTWYYMTDDTKVVYVDSQYNEVNDNTGVMILVKDTNNVDVIYVYAD